MIWASDNGRFLGEHGLEGKWLMYEESIRIPLIIRDPRQDSSLRGRRVRQMALNIDLAPTMLGFAGAAIPKQMQGENLAGIVAGSNRILRQDWYYEHFYDHNGKIRPSEGVRTDEWKYIRYPKENPPFEQLFHLLEDPYELDNLAQNADYGAILTRLRNRCDAYRQELM